MKKVLFLAVFGVLLAVLAVSAEAGYRGSFCTPSPNRQFGQLNWRHESGGIFPGHLDSMRGPWIPPPECYRPPQYNSYYPPQYDPRYDRRYDRRHDRRHGGDNGEIIAGTLGGVALGAGIVILDRLLTRPQPEVVVRERVIERPVLVEREVPAPAPAVASGPQAFTTNRRCASFRVIGDNQEAVWAVERALRSRGYGVSSVGCEIAVRYEEVGDPQARIFLRVTDASGSVRHADGSQFYKRGDTLARADAIVIAARTAVGNL